MLSKKIAAEKWGAKVISKISSDIQKEFAGIKGFSPMNLKNMRRFYEAYSFLKIISQPNKLTDSKKTSKKQSFEIGQAMPVQFQDVDTEALIQYFFQIGFTHHILLLQKCKKIEKRLFYLQKIVKNQWSSRVLQHHIETKLYENQGKIQSNFSKVLPPKLHKHALQAFKDEYLLNYIDVQNEADELAVEQEIVNNIKKFLISLGEQFCFISNQHRLIVDGEAFFVDLLFFHRGLQAGVFSCWGIKRI